MSSTETPATGASYRSFQVGDWIVDPAAGQIIRDGVPVKLEHIVMEVLSYLASRPGELVTRDDLEREVPSLVTVGAPKLLSSTTLRPLGPRVTFTALANR